MLRRLNLDYGFLGGLGVMLPRFTKGAKIYWCLECNVPVVEQSYCSKCSSVCFRVKLTPPSDIRPCFEDEVKDLRELVKRELGLSEKELDLIVPRNQLVFFNKIPYIDAADEVVVQGQIVGHRYYDPVSGKWRFKPMYHGVARLLENRVGYYAVVDLPRFTKGYEIHGDRLVEANLPEEKEKYVALVTVNGEVQGVGVKLRGKRIRVAKYWSSKKPLYLNKPSSVEDLLKANVIRLERLVLRSKKILERTLEKHSGKRPIVSYSGGKDSLVTLHIALNSVGVDEAIFNDTGLELPETLENVDKVAELYGLRLHVASAGNRFFDSLWIYGPPARDYRWCCKVCKLTPIARTYREVTSSEIISIVGQRKYESIQRYRQRYFEKSRWLPKVYLLSPILDWSALEVWLYVFKEKLPYNALYAQGLDRIGCWLCPACELAEFNTVKTLHPELWDPWEKYLMKYAEKRSLPGEWVKYGWWRWKKLPGDQKRFIKKLGLNIDEMEEKNQKIEYVSRVKKDKNSIIVYFSIIVDLKKVEALLPIYVDEYSLKEDKLEFTSPRGNKISLYRSFLKIELKNTENVLEDFTDIIHIALRATLCSKCYSCVNWCPNNAIIYDSLIGGFRVIRDKCSKCKICNKECPTVRYVGSNIIKNFEPLIVFYSIEA